MSREIEDGLGHSGLVATRAEREQDRRDQTERKRFKQVEAERDLYRSALQTICNPDKCRWAAPEMFRIAQAALEGREP